MLFKFINLKFFLMLACCLVSSCSLLSKKGRPVMFHDEPYCHAASIWSYKDLKSINIYLTAFNAPKNHDGTDVYRIVSEWASSSFSAVSKHAVINIKSNTPRPIAYPPPQKPGELLIIRVVTSHKRDGSIDVSLLSFASHMTYYSEARCDAEDGSSCLERKIKKELDDFYIGCRDVWDFFGDRS